MFFRYFAAFLACFLCLSLMACGGQSIDIDEHNYHLFSDDDLFAKGNKLFNEGEFAEAVKAYSAIEKHYPYSKYAALSQLKAGISLYRLGDYEQAVAFLDRFVTMHPGHKDAPKALYAKSLCYYDQILNIQLEQRMSVLAKQSFEFLINRHPKSEYATKAKPLLQKTVDQMAGKHMQVGRYYIERGHFPAAIRRFQRVVEDFPTSNQVPEALYRLTEAHIGLGLPVEAVKYASVLGHNYRGSVWYEKAFDLIKNHQ